MNLNLLESKMFKDIAFYLFAMIAIINTIHFGIYIAGANLYDIKQFFRKRKISKTIRRKYRPLVTIIVPAHNEEVGIIKTLESIRKNSYRKLQILVVDDASSDATRSLVWRYIQLHPNRNIHLLRKQKNVGKGEAMNHALKTAATGELMMSLDADSIIDKNAISNAVRHFEDPRIVGIAANVQIMDNGTLLGLLQKFEHMIGYRSKKFYTLTNSEFIIGGVASTYRMDIIKKAKFYDTDTQTEDIGLSLKIVSSGNINQRIIYAADVLAITEGVQSYKSLFIQRYRWKLGMLQNLVKHGSLLLNNDEKYSRMLTLYRLPMALFGELVLLIEPILLVYIIYLSIAKAYPFALLGAYVTITLYVLWTVWPDEHMPNREKMRMSLYSPIMYFIFYVMNVVQLTSILRCIKNNKKVLRKVDTGGSWISPERATI